MSNSASLNESYEHAVRNGMYPSVERLDFWCRQFFRGVTLEGRRVLDIGCGKGLLLVYARLAGARSCVGLEPEEDGSTEGSLRALRLMIRELGISEVEVRPDRLENFASEGRVFDVNILCNTLNHLDQEACDRLPRDSEARERYHRLFGMIGRLVEPEGRLIVTDCGRHHLFAPLTRLGIPHPFEPAITWRKHQEPRVWAALLKESGFSVGRITWRVPNRLRRLEWLLSNGLVARCRSSDFKIVARRTPAAGHGGTD